MKSLIKKITPPFIFDSVKKMMTSSQWSGDFKSWAEASAQCTGYSEKDILEKLIHSQRVVSEGRATFERDTVLFFKEEYNFPVLASLFRTTKQDLSVVDFGGALGSTFFQNRKALESLISKWAVVEQPQFVEAGIREFQDERLVFFSDLKEAVQSIRPQVLFSSSTLQYLEKPFEMIEKMILLDVPFILLDRISFHQFPQTRLTVQKVPEEIYDASYPSWFFKEEDFLKAFQKKYELIWDFQNQDVADVPSYFKGFLLKKI